MEAWQDWLKQQREGVKISLEQVQLPDADVMHPWAMMKGGIYGRKEEPSFWAISGQRVTVTKEGQEPFRWSQPMIITSEGSHGYLVLAKIAPNVVPAEFLLCADMAPGRGTLELRPTLQTSKSKLQLQPNFPRRELVEMVKDWRVINCDANVFLYKTISVGVVSFHTEAEFANACGELNANERWFTREEIREALATGEIGDHLATALAVATF